MSINTYTVVGMTCSHCVNAVTEEVTAGAVTVTSEPAAGDDAVRAAVEEAGYELAGRAS